MKSRIQIIVLSGILFIGSVCGAQVEERFSIANDLYQSAEYDSAIAIYHEILDQGLSSSELYFNIGNAYYKNGQIPEAILNFERAKKLSPGDDDIRHNLALANANTVDKIDPIPMVFYEEWWVSMIQNSTVSSKAKTAIFLIWLSLLLWIVYLFLRIRNIRKLSFYSFSVCLIIGLLILGLAFLQNKEIQNSDAAILFSTSAYVKSSPEKSGENLFLLHEGTKVVVIDELSGWKKIKVANGNVGWIDEKVLVII